MCLSLDEAASFANQCKDAFLTRHDILHNMEAQRDLSRTVAQSSFEGSVLGRINEEIPTASQPRSRMAASLGGVQAVLAGLRFQGSAHVKNM